MVASWVVEEMASTDLNDERLDKRLARVLSDLADRPSASIPAACGGHAEMTGAYRLFNNAKATPVKILGPHQQQTRQRIAQQSVALLVQDTSEIDLTRPAQQVRGAGPLDDSARRGAFLHAMQAFTTDGTPLGMAWCDTWARDEASLAEPQKSKRKKRKAAPIEAKESYRWLRGLRESRAVAECCPNTRCVCIADSEADIYELFAEARGVEHPVHWLVRLCQERGLATDRDDLEEAEQAKNVRDHVSSQPVLETKRITVRGRKAKIACEERGRRQSRTDRHADVTVRAAQVTLRPPRRAIGHLPTVTVNAVLVQEINPPAGEAAVEWLLLTTLPIDDVEAVREVIQYYCVRWMIEVFFRTLKSGCRIEARLFETLDAMLACLAVYLIVTWRTLFVCRMGRSCPDMDCEAIFEPCEWQSVWIAVKQEALPQQPPRLADMIRLIAQLGGYVNRPERLDPPGPQTTWLGLQRMRDLAWAWVLFGPGAKRKDV